MTPEQIKILRDALAESYDLIFEATSEYDHGETEVIKLCKAALAAIDAAIDAAINAAIDAAIRARKD